jgi:hypothetical protein
MVGAIPNSTSCNLRRKNLVKLPLFLGHKKETPIGPRKQAFPLLGLLMVGQTAAFRPLPRKFPGIAPGPEIAP